MAPPTEVLEAMALAEGRVPAVVDRLKRLYLLTNSDVAEALGLQRNDVQARCSGKTKFTTAEIAGLAAFFGVPISTFYGTPRDALHVVIELDPELARFGATSGGATAQYLDGLVDLPEEDLAA